MIFNFLANSFLTNFQLINNQQNCSPELFNNNYFSFIYLCILYCFVCLQIK